MPFTNHIIPVDVTINGDYKGNYMFTEHKEVKDNRINIGDDGVLLEMDSYFDQAPWQFKSAAYDLPVMVQYPEVEEMSTEEATHVFQTTKSDFEIFESKLAAPEFPENDYLDYLDEASFVNYMIVYMLTDNRELNHPKSTYIHKLSGDQKYRMGIIWDFDWAFGYEGTTEHFINPDVPIFGENKLPGTYFFERILQSPEIRALLKTRWATFKAQKYSKLIDYIDAYADLIKDSMAADHDVWHNGSGDSEVEKQRMLDWLDKRVVYLDGFIGGM